MFNTVGYSVCRLYIVCSRPRQLKYLIQLERRKYSSIAQSVERMTVNHDVTGSSPVGGAISFMLYDIAFCFGRKAILF